MSLQKEGGWKRGTRNTYMHRVPGQLEYGNKSDVLTMWSCISPRLSDAVAERQQHLPYMQV